MRILVLLGFLLAGCGAPQPAKESRSGSAAEVPGMNSRASEPGSTDKEAVRPSDKVSPCMTQQGKAVTVKLKALGTEPFWAAEVEGRCVTYKTPEDQHGVRVWTQMAKKSDGTVWNGALDARQFQLTVKPAAGCSDGMSDRIYEMEAVLRVRGETRRGCAAPLSDQPNASPAAPN